MRGWFWLLAALLAALGAPPAGARDPVIDMHLHADDADAYGPAPLALCTPLDPMPTWDQRTSWAEAWVAYQKAPPCRDPVRSPTSDDGLRDRTLAELARWNVIGVIDGDLARLRDWRARSPGRVLFGFDPTSEEMASAAALLARAAPAKAAGEATIIGEIGAQYRGIGPDDPRLAGLWDAAERLDVPVAIHMGPGPPGVAYLNGTYRAALSNPLALEDVLVRHPRLRVQIMHAAYPLLDATLALLYAHPQVYVDTGVIVWSQPRAAFYRYLKALIEAGFGKRIMFGSDQMVWPETIGRSIRVIEEAPFLTRAQKRDILYDNAARFLRLDAATIARHHALR